MVPERECFTLRPPDFFFLVSSIHKMSLVSVQSALRFYDEIFYSITTVLLFLYWPGRLPGQGETVLPHCAGAVARTRVKRAGRGV